VTPTLNDGNQSRPQTSLVHTSSTASSSHATEILTQHYQHTEICHYAAQLDVNHEVDRQHSTALQPTHNMSTIIHCYHYVYHNTLLPLCLP